MPMVEIAKPGDLAILVYTSGTTGPPKGAMLSHRNILFQLGFSDFISEPREGDQQLSFLPLAHIAERTFSVFYPLHSGATVNFAENIDTVPANVREVAPAVFFAAGPRGLGGVGAQRLLGGDSLTRPEHHACPAEPLDHRLHSQKRGARGHRCA